jgi:hypothetical protein
METFFFFKYIIIDIQNKHTHTHTPHHYSPPDDPSDVPWRHAPRRREGTTSSVIDQVGGGLVDHILRVSLIFA